MIDKIFTGAAGELFDKVSGLVDDLVTTKEEKLAAKLEMRELILQAERDAELRVSERWDYDMKSDNKLSKNIRPIVLIFLTIVFVFISFFDGNVGHFELDEAYKNIYQTLLMTVYGAYFAGRSFEKVNLGTKTIDAEVEMGDPSDRLSRRERRRSRKEKGETG